MQTTNNSVFIDTNILVYAMCDLFLKPLSKPLPETERGFDYCSPSLLAFYDVHTSFVAVISLLKNLALRFYPASE